MKVIIDCDACPRGALAASIKTAHEYGATAMTVADFSHEIESDCHITVGKESQAADIKIMNITSRGDVVVTQDIGLAAAVMGKGARAIGVTGYEYLPERIDAALEERAVKAKFRRAGGRTKGPAKRTKADDERFAKTLSRILAEESQSCPTARESGD